MTEERRSQLDLFGAPREAAAPAAEGARPVASPAPVAASPASSAAQNVAPASPDGASRAPAASPVAAPPGSPSVAPPAPPASPSAARAARFLSAAGLAPIAPRPAPAPAGPEVLGVAELARRLRGTLEQGFAAVHVRGEVSNLRTPGSGHAYFTLKEPGAQLRAVLFKGGLRALRFPLKDGLQVVARGRVSFYEQGGDAQLVCETLEPAGQGALALAFEELKQRLAKEGLFDERRKRPLPYLPRGIGVVTSPTGAAIRDFLRVLHGRFPGLPVYVAPARVQGEGAAAELVEGLRRLQKFPAVDVIVLTRGGGSLEDLFCFNDEALARAIAACPKPVVSAVGHEVDFTIADFVADHRAPTPSAAAERLAPVERELRERLAVQLRRLTRQQLGLLQAERDGLEHRTLRLGDPASVVAQERLSLDARRQALELALRARIEAARRGAKARSAALAEQHPAARLRRDRAAASALRERLLRGLPARLRAMRDATWAGRERLTAARPDAAAARLALQQTLAKLHAGARAQVAVRRRAFATKVGRLDALSPLAVLARGYAVAFREDGRVLVKAADATAGEALRLELGEGALLVTAVGPAHSRRGV